MVGPDGALALPWLEEPLRRALATQRGHALLIHGPQGVGQFELALTLAQAWLCESEEGARPCGRCASCRLVQVVASRREDEQRFGQRVHRLVQHQLAQALGERRAARLARAQHRRAGGAQAPGHGVDVRRLAGTVDALERDEARRHGYLPRWYLSTARLCAARLSLNSLLPSPRDTK